MLEREAKFIVTNPRFIELNYTPFKETIGYFFTGNTHISAQRIVVDEDRQKAWFFIKGHRTNNGRDRFEFETEVDIQDARELLKMCDAILERDRYHVKYDDTLILVDHYYDVAEEDIWTAEVEFEIMLPKLPQWIGKEVTKDTSYSAECIVHAAKDYKAKQISYIIRKAKTAEQIIKDIQWTPDAGEQGELGDNTLELYNKITEWLKQHHSSYKLSDIAEVVEQELLYRNGLYKQRVGFTCEYCIVWYVPVGAKLWII